MTGEEKPAHGRWGNRSAHSVARGELTEQQDGKCAICGDSESELRRVLALDHDHETGAIRGLLCDWCNTLLGLAKDSPYILRNAAAYLEANGV